MNRRKFISLLGLAPFLPSLLARAASAKKVWNTPTVTALSKGQINEFMGFKFVRAEGPMQGPPHFAVIQQTGWRPDMNFAWEVLTRVSMNGKEELIFVTFWDEDMSKALDTTTADAIERTRRYWAARDRWQRKAREANWRTDRFSACG